MNILEQKKFSGIGALQKRPVDILIVDDDADITTIMSNYLENLNFTTEKVTNPKYLPEVLAKVAPRLIILDMLLFGRDGRDVCRTIKNTEATDEVKVIMISGHADAEWTCKDAGADEFIAKPFSLAFLTEAVRRHLEE